MTRGPTCRPPLVSPALSPPSSLRPRPTALWWWRGGEGGWAGLEGGGGGSISPLPLALPQGGAAMLALPIRVQRCCTGRPFLPAPYKWTCVVARYAGCSPHRGLVHFEITSGTLAGQTRLLPAPMDGVPYPQPLTRHQPQCVPWGVPCVRPIDHPPRPVSPWAAGLRSQAYPAFLHMLKRGRYGYRGHPLTP